MSSKRGNEGFSDDQEIALFSEVSDDDDKSVKGSYVRI